jgi:phage baseplate assembly protein W
MDYFDIRRKGLKFPLIPSENGNLKQIEDTYKLTDQNIRHFIVTNEKERVMRPELGLGLRKFLAEPLNDATTEVIENYILNKLNRDFKTVRVVAVKVQENIVPNQPTRRIEIRLKYHLVKDLKELTYRDLYITLVP